MRVPVIPLSPVIQSPVQAPRVVPPKPLPSSSPLGLGLPPAQLSVLIPLSLERPAKRPVIRKPPNHPDLTRRTEGTFYRYNTRFGRAAHNIAQDVSMEQYAHHIAGLTTPTQEAPTKKNSLDRLLKGPEAEIWSRSNSSEWGRLLPNGVGKYCPESKSIAGTGTTFLSTSHKYSKAERLHTPTGSATSTPKRQKLTGSK